MPRHYCCLCLTLLTLLSGCADDHPTPPPAVFQLAGRAIAAGGSPVAGAAVLLEYDCRSATRPGGLFSAGTVIEIRDDCGTEPVLVDTVEAGGVYIWPGTDDDGKYCPEGRYWVVADGRLAMPYFLARTRADDPANYARIAAADVRQHYRVSAWTDADGRFDLSAACLACGLAVIFCNSDYTAIFGELTPAWRARLWFYDDAHETGRPSPWHDIDPQLGANLVVELQP